MRIGVQEGKRLILWAILNIIYCCIIPINCFIVEVVRRDIGGGIIEAGILKQLGKFQATFADLGRFKRSLIVFGKFL